MGNFSHLRAVDSRTGRPGTFWLESKNDVPICWLPMFDAADLHDKTADGDAFVPPPATGTLGEATTYAACPGDRAVERLTTRAPALIAAIGHGPLLWRFIELLKKKVAGKTVILELTPVAAMVSPGEYAGRARAQLAAFATMTPASAPSVIQVADDFERQPHAEPQLIGWNTKLTKNEISEVTQRKRAASAQRTQVEARASLQTALAATAADERKPYRATGAFAVGDLIDHPTFGAGLVVAVRDGTKMDVQFETAQRTLAYRAT